MRAFFGWEKREVARRIAHALELSHALSPKQEKLLRTVAKECLAFFERLDGNVSAPSKRNRRPISPAVRFAVLVRDGHRCVYCGVTSREARLDVDHVKPVSQGGSDAIENLATACFDCNLGKSDRWGPE